MMKFFFVLLVTVFVASDAGSNDKPNILFMMSDQMRGDLIDADILDLPSINSIGANGIRFKRAYSTTPTCTPARAAILTGQKPWNHGMLGYSQIADKYPFEMPTALKNLAGYHTAVVGKDHFGFHGNTPVAHGYDFLKLYEGLGDGIDDYNQWFMKETGKPISAGYPGIDNNCWKGRPYALNEELHPTAWTGRAAVDWLKQNGTKMSAAGTPWLLKVSFHRPHSPYSPPQRFLENVTEDNLPPTRLASDGWDTRFRDEYGCAQQSAGCDQWCGLKPYREMTLGRRAYRAEAQFVDSWVGKVLDTLKEEGLLGRTLIVWTSDHGDCQGDHYLHRKGYAYECAASVPMLLQWPQAIPLPGGGHRVRLGSELEGLVELRDLLPTFMEAAGVPAAAYAARVDGSSLLCFLRGGCEGWREWLDLEHNVVYAAINHWNALVSRDVKYVFTALDASEQLFNLTADPYEQENLAGRPEHAATLLLWRMRLLSQWRAERRGAEWYSAEGKLLARPPIAFSPHYPGPRDVDLGDELDTVEPEVLRSLSEVIV